MNFIVTGIKINEDGVLELVGSTDQNTSKLILKERSSATKKNNLVELIFDIETENEQFNLNIDLNQYEEKLQKGYVFDPFVKGDDGKIYPISLKHFYSFEREPFQYKDSIFSVELYKNKKENLSIRINSELKIVKAEIKNIDRRLLVNFTTNSENQYKQQMALRILKLENKNLNLIQSEKIIQIDCIEYNQYSGSIDLDLLVVGSKNNDFMEWDVVIVNSNNEVIKVLNTIPNGLDLQVDTIDFGYFHLECNAIEGRLFKTHTIINELSQETLAWRVNDNSVEVKAKLTQLKSDESTPVLYFRNRVRYKDASREFGVIPIKYVVESIETDNEYKVSNISFILEPNVIRGHHYSHSNTFFDLYVSFGEVGNNEFLLKADKTDIEKFNSLREGRNVTFYRALDNGIASRVLLQEGNDNSNRKIKLGIIGSCFSRLAFSSAPYFNPTYKNRYEISYTIFHSAIPSLMSEPIEYLKEDFSDKEGTLMERLESELNKKYISVIENEKIDYLIIDLYADVACELMKFPNGAIATANPQMKLTKFYDRNLSTFELIEHDNIEKYLEYWLPALDGFVKKIKENNLETKIILQRARMATAYLDENNKKLRFNSVHENFIRNSNYVYTVFENYLLDALPNIRIIDLNDGQFLSVKKFPNGFSPNHYEKGYYKAFLGKLDEIVLVDLLNS